MSINEKMSQLVEERGIKQTHIAQAVGMSNDRISKILNGKRKMLADEFLSLCVALNVDPNVFR